MNLKTKQLDQLTHRGIILAFHFLLFLTPFLWTSETYELFEFPKMMFTYGLTVIIASLWLTRMALQKKLLIHRTPLDFPIGLFLLSQVLSTIFSIDFHTSLIGYYSRFNGGLFSTLSYLTLFYAALTNLNKNHLKKLLLTILAALTISSLYSFPEHFGLSPSCILLDRGANAECWKQDVVHRVFGTFGQPNWQAAYIITLIFTAFAFLKKSLIKKSWLKTGVFSTITLLSLSVLIFTKSRSGVLAFSAGFGCYWLLSLITSNQKRRSLSIGALVTGLTLGLFVIFGQDFLIQLSNLPKRYLFTNQPSQTTSPATTPLAQPAGGTESGDIRQIVWSGAIELFKEYPIFGSGVETFGYAYYNVRPVEHNLVSEWDFLYNKAHNEHLNLLATTGLFGLGTYLLFVFTFYGWSLKHIFKNKDLEPFHRNLLIAFISGHLALNISNFFGFSTVSVQQLFYLFPAFAAILIKKSDQTSPSDQKLENKQAGFIAIIFLSTAFLLFSITKSYTADIIFTKGRNALQAQDLYTALEELQQAVQMAPREPLYLDYLSSAAAQAAARFQAAGEANLATQMASQAEAFSDRTLSLNPVHLNFYKTRARVFAQLNAIDPSYSQKAMQTLQTAIRLAPTDAKLWLNLGLLHQQLENHDQAIQAYQRAIELKPNYEHAYFQLGKVYESLEQFNQAKNQYQFILENINPQNPAVIEALHKVATMSGETQ